jgi:pyridoxamine 5'-phosphate oxidase-like protein
MTEKTEAIVIATDTKPGTEPLRWGDVRQWFGAERSYWVATAGSGDRPQVRPVLAVWIEDKVYSTTSPDAAKGRNLSLRAECSLAAHAPAVDIVVEGTATWVTDRHVLERVAAAYDDKYGWPVTITEDNMFDAPYGAPTAGTPPYRAYEISPRVVYAFGTDNDLGVRSTRFRLS